MVAMGVLPYRRVGFLFPVVCVGVLRWLGEGEMERRVEGGR